jgi:predicted Zn-dependent peptidase
MLGLRVLEEWAAYASLTPEEIDKRGVVIEEWRLGRGTPSASGQARPSMPGNHCANACLSAMDHQVPPEAVRRFYEMLSSDLMSIIAVGD